MTGPYQTFANRLINTMKEKGFTAARSPKGICIKSLSQFSGASLQISRRYIRGDGLPDYEKVKKIAYHLEVNPGWLLFGDEGHSAPSRHKIDETLLQYILKQSRHLYRNDYENNDYVDFVLDLMKKVRSIDTSKDNLIKIIDLTIRTITSYEQTRKSPMDA